MTGPIALRVNGDFSGSGLPRYVTDVEPLSCNCQFWLRADDFGSLSLGAGNVMISWTDQVLNAVVGQSTNSARPIYGASVFRGGPGITFDGVDDFLTLSNVPVSIPAGTSDCTVFMVYEGLDTDANLHTLAAYGNSSPLSSIRKISRTGSDRPQLNDGSPLIDASHFVAGVHAILATWSGGGTTESLTFDGEASSLNTSGAFSTGRNLLRLGADTSSPNPASFSHMRLRDFGICGALTTDQRDRLTTWAKWRAGRQA